MKKLLLILFLTFIPIKAQAIIIDISVQGMVCDFCAQSIEKVFMKQPGVEVVYVNLDRQNVQVKMANN